MRKLLLPLLGFCSLLLVGCLETTQEITLNEDGSGTLVNKTDLSSLIGMAKNMGGGGDMEKLKGMNIDSSFALEKGVDSIPNLTAEEKELARKGMVKIKANLDKEEFVTGISFPFASFKQVPVLTSLSAKIMAEVMKEEMAGGQDMGDQAPETSSFDDYYEYEFSNGEITRKVNKQKYAGVESDEFFKGMQQAAGMGLTMKATYIINLPRPATKAEGKNLKLSDDKKKVTITADVEDFMVDPSVLEFKIKY